ncbi:hypothetical protein AMTRI_Chr01g136130 [Amborella trichopoda]
MTTAVRVLDVFNVSPPPFCVPKEPQQLTFLDVFWFPISPVQRIFFYNPLEQESNFSDLVDKLKNSLSLVLEYFYPLAGKIALSADSEHLEIHYKDGDGVAFYVAETEVDYEALVTSRAHDTTIFKLLVPPLSARFPAPMVSVQATGFPDGGLCIGVSFNHGAADGRGFISFVKAWAEVCRSGGLSSHPNHDRSVLRDPGRLSKWYVDWYKISKEGVGLFPEFPKLNDLVIATFLIGKDGIARLKRQATSSGSAVPSTFAAVSAHIWVCTARARNLGDDSMLVYAFPADGRSQLKPKVTDQYFGNCVYSCIAKGTGRELKGKEPLVWAAEAIGSVIREGRADPFGGAKTWLSQFTELVGTGFLSVAGSPRFGVYETDFGWGRPRRVEVVSIDKEGGIALSEARDEEGGVQVSLSLRSSEMHQFESLFFKGLNDA